MTEKVQRVLSLAKRQIINDVVDSAGRVAIVAHVSTACTFVWVRAPKLQPVDIIRYYIGAGVQWAYHASVRFSDNIGAVFESVQRELISSSLTRGTVVEGTRRKW